MRNRLKNPTFVHFWLTILWALNLVVVWFLPADWRIPYLIIVSIYANLVGHWAAYEAAKAQTSEVTETVDVPDDIPDS